MQAMIARARRFMGRKVHQGRSKLRPWLFNLAQLPSRMRHGRVLPAYWLATIDNFGDAITPLLLSHYGFTPIHTPPTYARLAATGSILEHLPSNFSGYILGSGLISDAQPQAYPAATILGVRGSYTRDLIQAPRDSVLGDPGLLLPLIAPKLPATKYLVGLIPHYADKNHHAIAKLAARHPSAVHIIDVQRSPFDVLHEIAQCEYILSSSLHGVIVADALNTPNAWVKLSTKVKGNGFKFQDYYSAYQCSYQAMSLSGNETLPELVSLTHAPAPTVSQIQHALDARFKELPHLLA